MIKYGVYVVKDLKTTYMTPMIDNNDESAKRGFMNAMLNPANTVFRMNPQDFELYRIGYYDSETGVIEPCDKELICTGGVVVHDSQTTEVSDNV